MDDLELELLRDTDPHHADDSLRRLLDAADMACQFWGDSKHARAEMRRQIAETPPEHHADLLAHFEREYPAGGAS